MVNRKSIEVIVRSVTPGGFLINCCKQKRVVVRRKLLVNVFNEVEQVNLN